MYAYFIDCGTKDENNDKRIIPIIISISNTYK